MATAWAAPSTRRRVVTADFTMTLDERGLVHVVPIGEWEPRTVDLYFLAMSGLMADSRRDAGRALVLVDRRNAPIASPDIAARIKAGFRRHFKPGDRVAVVSSTTLLKLEIKRMLGSHAAGAFLSIGAAEHFLLAP